MAPASVIGPVQNGRDEKITVRSAFSESKHRGGPKVGQKGWGRIECEKPDRVRLQDLRQVSRDREHVKNFQRTQMSRIEGRLLKVGCQMT